MRPALPLLALGAAALLGATPKKPMDPIIRQVSASLDRYPLVGIGDGQHRQKEIHLLHKALIDDPRVFCKIDAIAVEFGNSALQHIADRYVAGGDVPLSEKRRIWRDTGQWMVWDSPIYEDFFDAVRAANLRRICPRPVRVLLADPPIDWSKVHSAADYRPYRVRDEFFADLVEREVLAKGKRALLIAGDTHLWKAFPQGAAEKPRAAMLITRRHPQALISFTALPRPDASGKAGLPPPPSLTMSRGTEFGGRPFHEFLAADDTIEMNVDGRVVERPLSEVSWPATEQVVDGFLNLGPLTDVDADPATYREPAYQAELRRRAAILKDVHGIDFLAYLEEMLER